MVRELVKNTIPVDRPRVSVSEWIDTNFDPSNYTSDLVATYESTGVRRSNNDYFYKVVSVTNDYRAARTLGNFVIPLGVPLNLVRTKAAWLKKHDDELFCNAARTGRSSEPSWNLCAHADFTRAGDFMHHAARKGEDFVMHVSVAITIIESMKFYCANIPEYREMCLRVFQMPKASDSMQKYIACIVLDVDYSPMELDLIVRTAITRNRKSSKDDLSPLSAMLVLLPMVKKLFEDTRSRAIRQNHPALAARMLLEYNSILATLVMTVKQKDPIWIDAVCALAICFGLPSDEVSKLRSELGTKRVLAKRFVLTYQLPNDHMSWIRGRSADMRVVKLDNGASAIGLGPHTKCQFNLVPSIKSLAMQSYRLDMIDQRGHISVGSSPESEERDMLASSPIVVHFDTRGNTCLCIQDYTRSVLASQLLTIRFSGGTLTVTKIYPDSADEVVVLPTPPQRANTRSA